MNLLTSFGILLLTCAVVEAAADQSPWAFIETIKGGEVILQTKGRPLRRLNPNDDRGLILNSGETLDCGAGPGADVEGVTVEGMKPGEDPTLINLCGKKEPSPSKKEPSGSGPENGLAANAVKNLNKYQLGGRPKGNESPIFNPPDNGAVLADKFVVRWRTRPPLDKFTAVLQDGNTELARVPDVDGTTGVLDSGVLGQALTKYRDSGDSNHQLRMVFKFDGSSEQSATFTVLTRKEEEQLNTDLGGITSETGLFRYVQRAAIYDSFHLYGMVAAEYDAALVEAPQSHDLLRAALDAHARIGDLHRARELRDRLQQVEEATGKN